MTSIPFDAVRVPKAAELVASELRRQIIVGELSEDDSLPSEAVLMGQFNVSRPTLREAFRILESESLISVRRGARGGARVRPPDGAMAAQHLGSLLQYRGTTMEDVYRARTILERPLGELVAHDERATSITRLEASVTSAEQAVESPTAFLEHELEFHLLVAELAGNQTLRTMLATLYHIVEPARRRYSESVSPDELGLEQKEVHRTHAYFTALIRRGDSEGAADLWARHLDEIERHYTARPLAKTVVEMLT